MTQISSFTNWLGDFLQRCFARKYEVKCSNKPNSSVKHDFRQCSACGARVDSLNSSQINKRCSECQKFLLSDGFYQDEKGRQYSLLKPLYSPRDSWGIVIFIAVWAVAFSIFEYHSFTPNVFEWRTQVFCLNLILTIPIVVQLRNFSVSKFSNYSGKILIVGLCAWAFLGTFIAANSLGLNHNWTFRWENPPTQVEWEAQQKEVAVAKYEGLEGLDKVRFAIENHKKHPGSPDWHFRAKSAYIEALKYNFPSTITEFGNYFLGRLSGDDRQSTLVLYKHYLQSVSLAETILPTNTVYYQCDQDPWNLISVKTIVENPEISDLCKEAL